MIIAWVMCGVAAVLTITRFAQRKWPGLPFDSYDVIMACLIGGLGLIGLVAVGAVIGWSGIRLAWGRKG